MFRIDVNEFLYVISKGLKKSITKEDVFGSEIQLSHLKRIDKLFERGLHYYLDPKPPEDKLEASVFFRKEKFQTNQLNIGSIKIVNQFERLKLSLSAMAKLADYDFKRSIEKYYITDSPESIAKKTRKILYPDFVKNRRDFLKSFISKLASKNIMVFEFIETWNKKEKANIDGFYLKPNMIVLKRHQSFYREIFTLAHELGHYLLGEEEIEQVNHEDLNNNSLSYTERWCNDFAFSFLVGEYAESIDTLEVATVTNNYHHEFIHSVSQNTHLSRLALFTRLLYKNRISKANYALVKNKFEEEYQKKEMEKQRLKDQGLKQRGSVAKPIISPMYISTIQTAFYSGILNEYEACEMLNIKSDELGSFIE